MLAHLYGGEMYSSKVWRTRLDATTNWAVATTGIALSVAFSNAGNSPLPLVLAHARLMEVSMYGPLSSARRGAR
jgi:uncharacterized membrane protein